MKILNQELLEKVKNFVEEYCDNNGYGPTVREVAEEIGTSRSIAHRYMMHLTVIGKLTKGRTSYESTRLSMEEEGIAVAKVGVVPCGPLSEEYENIDGYVRLPASFVGNAKKCYLLTASGNSMIGAGINDGDLVLIKQQNHAEIGDIIVALVDNEVTLKRLGYDQEEQRYFLHPENKRMKDMYVDSLEIQGVAIKVIKDL